MAKGKAMNTGTEDTVCIGLWSLYVEEMEGQNGLNFGYYYLHFLVLKIWILPTNVAGSVWRAVSLSFQVTGSPSR
jgi:hypothetical protein